MTQMPFQIKSPVGRSYRVEFDDTRRTKEALLRLGYFKTPRYGLTQYPDEPLFSALEEFQQANGLYRDGVMRPEGETATHLGRALADLEQRQTIPSGAMGVMDGGHDWEPWRTQVPRRASEILQAPNVFGIRSDVGDGRDNDPTDVLATERALAWAGYHPTDGSSQSLSDAIKRFQADQGLDADGWMRPRGPTARTLDETITSNVLTWREMRTPTKLWANQEWKLLTLLLRSLRANRRRLTRRENFLQSNRKSRSSAVGRSRRY